MAGEEEFKILYKDNKVRCPLCDKWFGTPHALFAHLYSKHWNKEVGEWVFEKKEVYVPPPAPEKPKQYYRCKFCGAVFDSEELALKHLQEVHPKEWEELLERAKKEVKKKRKRKKA